MMQLNILKRSWVTLGKGDLSRGKGDLSRGKRSCRIPPKLLAEWVGRWDGEFSQGEA